MKLLKTFKYQKVSLKEIGTFTYGNENLNRDYCENNSGIYPVYSNSTKDDEKFLGKIQTYQFDDDCLKISKKTITWDAEIIPKHKFSVAGQTYIFCLNEKYKNNIDYEFVKFFIKHLGWISNFFWKKKYINDEMESWKIKIPINDNGRFDVKKQKIIIDELIKKEKINKLCVKYCYYKNYYYE